MAFAHALPLTVLLLFFQESKAAPYNESLQYAIVFNHSKPNGLPEPPGKIRWQVGRILGVASTAGGITGFILLNRNAREYKNQENRAGYSGVAKAFGYAVCTMAAAGGVTLTVFSNIKIRKINQLSACITPAAATVTLKF